MKKFFALLIAVAMVLSLVTVPAMAEGTRAHDPRTGTAPRVHHPVTADAATIDEALNVEGGTLVFTNDATYPWIIVGDAAQSGNAGVASSESSITTTVTAAEGDIVQFDYQAWGEGSNDSYDWDKCRFYVDSNLLMDYGAHQNDWETFQYALTAGEHTLTWTYKKDSSVNPTGDYFMVDNVYVGQPVMADTINVEDVSVPAGRRATVVYEVLPAAAYDKSVTFAIADTSIATVNANGVVTGVAEGTTTITVTSVAVPEVSGTATVTVTEALPTVNLYGYDTYDIGSTYDSQWIEFPDYDPTNYVGHGSMPTTFAAAFAGGNVYGYLYDNEGADTRFYIMDAETYSVAYPGTDASNVGGVFAMAYNYANDTMYALTGTDTRYIATVDLATGVVTNVAAITGMANSPMTLAIDAQGNAYALDLNSAGATLYSVNLETGAATAIGATGVGLNYVQSMTFDIETNQLFWAQILDGSTHGLYTIDVNTGAASYVGLIGPNGGEVTGLYTKNDIEIAPIEVPDVTVTFVDGVDNAVLDTMVVPAGTVLDENDFPTPPEHEGLEFVGWNYDGAAVYTDTTITARYRDPNAQTATVILNVPSDVWGDGSGYQMLLDADATAYGTIIPESGGLTSSGDAPQSVYDEFEYKIPENADGSMNTQNMISQGQIAIEIPGGVYDWCITNPTPGDRIWIASSNGNIPGRYDDYEFESGKTYTFTVTFGGQNDQVDLTIEEGSNPPTNPPTENPPTDNPPTDTPSNPPVVGIIWDFETDPEAQGFEFVDQDGDGNNWEWRFGDEWADFNYHEGQGYMMSASYINYVGALTPDNWMITPEFTGDTLTFWAQGQDASYAAEYLGIFVSEDGGNTWSNEIMGITLTGSDTQYTVDLSAYANVRGAIRVAIRHYNVTDMFQANVDYIEVVGNEVPPTEVPPTEVPPTEPPVPVTPAPDEVGFWAVPSVETVMAGEEFEVALNLTGEYEAHTMNLQFNYDENTFEIVGAPVQGEVLQGATGGMVMLDHTTIPGSIRLGLMMPTDPISGEGNVFTVTFRAKEDAQVGYYEFTPVVTEFTYFPVGGESTPIPYCEVPGYVQIVEEVPPTNPPTEVPPTEVPPTEVPPTDEPPIDEVIFSVDDYTAAPGTDVTVTVMIDGEFAAHGINMEFNYDPEMLTITNVANGDFMNAVEALAGVNVLDYETIPGSLRYGCMLPTEPVTATGSVFEVTFHVSENAEEGMVLPLEIVITEFVNMPEDVETEIPCTVDNGSITIIAGEQPPITEPPTTPPTPPTGTIALVGVGIAAIVAGAGVVLFRKKED